MPARTHAYARLMKPLRLLCFDKGTLQGYDAVPLSASSMYVLMSGTQRDAGLGWRNTTLAHESVRIAASDGALARP